VILPRQLTKAVPALALYSEKNLQIISNIYQSQTVLPGKRVALSSRTRHWRNTSCDVAFPDRPANPPYSGVSGLARLLIYGEACFNGTLKKLKSKEKQSHEQNNRY
jgi:hypothetical protein